MCVSPNACQKIIAEIAESRARHPDLAAKPEAVAPRFAPHDRSGRDKQQ
jgi:hypothetical protein